MIPSVSNLGLKSVNFRYILRKVRINKEYLLFLMARWVNALKDKQMVRQLGEWVGLVEWVKGMFSVVEKPSFKNFL